jgi:hypothetical protein
MQTEEGINEIIKDKIKESFLELKEFLDLRVHHKQNETNENRFN